MIRYFFSTLILGFFLLYGLITIIFVSPNNYLNITLSKYASVFDDVFYQRWGFFAPPPKSNDRLYFTYENKLDKSKKITYEILEPLLIKKSNEAPFNSAEEINDYLLSNSIYYINDVIINIREKYKYELKNEKHNEQQLQSIITKTIKKTKPYQTLLNYSKIVALRNNIDLKKHSIIIKISNVALPKFIDREKKLKCNEILIFDSSI